MNRDLMFVIALALTVLLQGCAAAVVAGAAGGAVSVAHDRRTTGRFIDDQTLELKVGKLIGDETALDKKVRINVTSMNGIVLLTGEAQSAELRDRVLSLARSADGVRRIYNHVRIAEPASLGDVSHDKWLYTKIKTKQTTASGVDPTRVKVVTSNSVAYLMGLVTRAEADAHTQLVRGTKGVAEVVKIFEYID